MNKLYEVCNITINRNNPILNLDVMATCGNRLLAINPMTIIPLNCHCLSRIFKSMLSWIFLKIFYLTNLKWLIFCCQLNDGPNQLYSSPLFYQPGNRLREKWLRLTSSFHLRYLNLLCGCSTNHLSLAFKLVLRYTHITNQFIMISYFIWILTFLSTITAWHLSHWLRVFVFFGFLELFHHWSLQHSF